MSDPIPRGTKRSASEQYEEQPNKRANIRDNLTPDSGVDYEPSIFERQLVPKISRAETAQFQDYVMDTGGAGQEDDESEDEFVDAQEAVVATPVGRATMLQSSEKHDIKAEAGVFPLENVKESEGIQSSNIFEEYEEIEQRKNSKQDEPEEGQQQTWNFDPLSSQQEGPTTFKVKPETISIASDSEDEGGEDETNDSSNPYGVDLEFEKLLNGEGGPDDDNEAAEEQAPITIEDDDDDEGSDQAEPFDDMFAATFGNGKAKAKGFNIKKSIEEDAASSHSSSFSSSNPFKTFTSGPHTTKIRSNSHEEDATTPPPPTTTISRPAPLPRRRPDTTRDLSLPLLAHSKFHSRTQHLIPRLPNHELFPWHRRYWIAVLINPRNPLKPTLSEKDFVWMKGNRFSTVSTVFHSYALAVMADVEDLGLLLAGEAVELSDQMQELDFFNDRLVVFRAVKVRGNEREAGGRSLVKGVIPEGAVISLDLD